MLVYRTDDDVRETRPAVAELLRNAEALAGKWNEETALALLMDLGEIEAGIADVLFPDNDGVHPLTTTLRQGVIAAARVLLDRDVTRIAALLQPLRSLAACDLPRQVTVGVPEGYVFYGLQPESYAAAAGEFVEACDPERAVCVGIRSIGTSLSAVVAAALERRHVRTRSCTVRPHGHPFDRQVTFRADLRERLLRSHAAWFLVVDEGPGLSGSSFASVATALTGLGIPAGRIALFPSWNPDGSAFKSEAARTVWQRHRRFCVNGADIGFSPVDVAHAAGERTTDLSAGEWRRHLLRDGQDWPAAHPQHERQKVWLRERDEIVRFTGLGRYGDQRRERAVALADGGLGPTPRWLARGHLALPFVQGRPCDAGALDERLINTIADYCAFTSAAFPVERRPGVAALIEMASFNVREAFGRAPDLERYRPALEGAQASAIDGRMLPHEWLARADGYAKADALDHHADHFFPGTQDAGWDLAGASIEFAMPRDAEERLVARYILRSGDRDVRARMPFYRIAYAAFRLGYCTIARDSLGTTPDGLRFARDAERYRRALTPSVP